MELGLKQWLGMEAPSVENHPVLRGVIELGLKQWLGMEAPSVENFTWTNKIQMMWKQQQELGWAHLFRGYIVQQWTKLQHEYLQSKNLLNNKCT
eukprot:7812931-Ditylum_brightwellii.AAC.1